MDTIGKRIKQLRKGNKLTQDRFGELCDVTKSAVSQWEKDRTTPDQSKLQQLRLHLTFSIDYILTGKPDYNSVPEQSIFKVSEPATNPLAETIYALVEQINDDGLHELIGFARCLTGTHPLVKAKPPLSA